MTSLVVALRSIGGIASIDELRSKGFGRGSIRAALSANELLRVRRGWYALATSVGGAPSDVRIRAARVGGFVACIDATTIHGIWRPPDARDHVSLFDHARHLKHPVQGHPIVGSGEALVVHWDAPHSLSYGQVVPIETALEQVLDCQPPDLAFAVIESALHMGGVDPRWADDCGRRHKKHHALLALAGSSAESGTESLFRYRLAQLGITMRSQVEIDGVGFVDFVIGDRLVVEIDSRAHHGDHGQRVRDLTRDAILAGLGYLHLRFDYWMILEDWETVASAIFAVVSRQDHLNPQSR